MSLCLCKILLFTILVLFTQLKSNFIADCFRLSLPSFSFSWIILADWFWQSLWKLIWWFSENWNNVDNLGTCFLFHICCKFFQKHYLKCQHATFLISFLSTNPRNYMFQLFRECLFSKFCNRNFLCVLLWCEDSSLPLFGI